MRVLLVGCGFLGGAAAELFSEAGEEVFGVCRTPESARRIGGRGFEAIEGDVTRAVEFPARWRGADVLVFCPSTRGGGAAAYAALYREGLLRAVAASRPRSVLFVGSTSVYGQDDGRWVDENSPATPCAATGRILLEAEGIVLRAGGCVARLAGLYGPGRSALLSKFLAGTYAPEIEPDRWVNQVHRDDAARAIVHLARRHEAGIYNVGDNRPACRGEIYRWMEARLGPRGRSLSGDALPARRKRGASNKRVSNAKLRATGWEPRFPSFRDALEMGAVGPES